MEKGNEIKITLKSLTFFVLLAFSFNPFPLDAEIYSSSPYLSPTAIVGQFVFVLFFFYTIYVAAAVTFKGNFYLLIREGLRNQALAIILVFALASVVWSVDPVKSVFSAVAQIATIFTIIILTHYIKTPSVAARFITYVVAICLAISLIGILFSPDRAIHHPGAGILLSEDLQGLWKGGFIHKNFAAGFLMLGLCISTIRIWQPRHHLKYFLLITGTALFLYYSGSVAAVYSPVLGFIAAYMLYLTRGIVPLRKSLAIIWVVCMFMFPWFYSSYIYPATLNSADGRAFIWMANLRLLGEHPLLGAGFQAVYTGATNIALYDNFGFISRLGTHAHSGAMEVLGQLGIFGAICVAIFIYRTIDCVVQVCGSSVDQNSSFILLFCLMTILVRANFEPDFFSQRIHWYFIIFMSLTANRILADTVQQRVAEHSLRLTANAA